MKAFKKILAVALVAVMALAMFTACGVSKSDLKDKIKDKTKLTYDSSLENDASFLTVKKAVDGLDKDDDDDDVENKIKKAVQGVTPTEGTEILYAVGGNEEELAKDINKQIDSTKGYKTFGLCSYNGHQANKKDNAVVVIVK